MASTGVSVEAILLGELQQATQSYPKVGSRVLFPRVVPRQLLVYAHPLRPLAVRFDHTFPDGKEPPVFERSVWRDRDFVLSRDHG